MKNLKNIGLFLIVGGGVLVTVMFVALYRSFSSAPDESSATALAEAVSASYVFGALGLLVFFVGLGTWGVGGFFGRRNKRESR